MYDQAPLVEPDLEIAALVVRGRHPLSYSNLSERHWPHVKDEAKHYLHCQEPTIVSRDGVGDEADRQQRARDQQRFGCRFLMPPSELLVIW